jgi:indole-3-glycerol phosphate synthase
VTDPARTTYLDGIVARHRRRAAGDDRDLGSLVGRARGLGDARGFADALRVRSEASIAVIAEVKRRSPSKGVLREGLDPAVLAADYSRGGAACLSVLTDEESFGGSAEDLAAARSATALPVLRKDFTVDPRDVCDARLMGADCVLLIAAVLDRREMTGCLAVAAEVGIDALVEVHDEAELDGVLGLGATMVGVNQRDLVTFEVDHARALRMATGVPRDVIAVAESGVRGADDARTLHQAGYHAVLVGEHLVTAADPAAAVGELITGT